MGEAELFHDYSLKFSLRPFEVGEVKGDEEVFWFNYFRVRLKFYVERDTKLERFLPKNQL